MALRYSEMYPSARKPNCFALFALVLMWLLFIFLLIDVNS
ncbi:hypothetical protein NCM_00687 [Burkholderia pseudomallei]|nr:putative membrane protein [Burkholderia pseudomallei HBPUB10134a]